MTDENEYRFGTRAVHAGQQPDPTTGAIMTPIYQTSTYAQEGIGVHKGHEYARVSNPTRTALEGNVAALEGAAHGAAFASGVAAIEAMVKLLSAGDHVICGSNVYGGTDRLFRQVLARLGLEFSFVDTREPKRIADAVTDRTRIVLVETPTNPMMHLTDIAAAAEIAHQAGAWLVVDNTFATPYFQKPLALGADAVVHSSTKYLNGHSDVVGGIVLTSDDEIIEGLRFLQKSAGAVPGPMDCWLVLRGTKTLHVRMEMHDANGRRIAEWLQHEPRVEAIFYAGLPTHPQHALAKKQMTGFGGMISIELSSRERAEAFLRGTRIFTLAESLGGVESLISHPAAMTHAAVPKEDREAMGITDGLVRLSVGIEDVEDLIEDLDRALPK
ncbi:MAG: cystathionine gamma-synthase [Gemmatimonadetes bacterium]|uniref:Cystathionine gamma-synthase n=1 Tax=Candidatus Kutchimonas denitrificans TaxID=3056748 RepID=A0AAE5CBB1_9BACT|nr:cystathionine gamma-synthase [Gemmatimonadota bacterium]NIR75602.1 cystathionine gamma-synthase [Candidatus Kutchimonas denitrificans]NIS01916.1 cystathionine gamma-synthase [Gemmatimonadota bacterium]NIT67697.1 cystathionine gamma-synthase [Gemmatimonadota bacterium]NIU53571.1 cystathionine gamma-synthase [Gemmatimonadota bacterium]